MAGVWRKSHQKKTPTCQERCKVISGEVHVIADRPHTESILILEENNIDTILIVKFKYAATKKTSRILEDTWLLIFLKILGCTDLTL